MTASEPVVAASQSGNDLPAKDRFQFLFAQTADLAKALPSYQFQFSAALTFVLGWLMTSENAGKFLRANPLLSRTGVVLLVSSLIVCHTFWVFRHVARAKRLHAELSRFAAKSFPDAKALIDSVSIDAFLPWSYIVINVLMCGAILVVCWLLSSQVTAMPAK